jgi:type I restriction enzyme S subunit
VSDFPLEKLSEVVRINPRNPDVVPAETDHVTFVPMAAVEAETGRFNASETRTWSAVKKGYTRFQENDVLVAKITPCMENGKACVARHLEGLVGAGSTEFHVLRPITSKVEPEWILRFVNQRCVRHEAKRHMSGAVGQQRVPASFYQDLQLPLPDLETQQELLERLEDHNVKIDATERALFTIQAKLKQARASILKAAVEGRLVGAKPILHDGQLEGENLTSIEVGDADRSSTAGKLSKKKASLSVPADVACAPLPDGWRWTTIDQESIFLKYGTSAKCGSDPDGVPVIRMGNIQDGAIVMDSIKYLPFDHAEFPDQLLTRGELLFNRTNSSDLVGKTAVFHGNQLHACASYIIRVKLKDTVLPELVAYNLNGPSGRAWAQSVASQQVGQANINSQKLRAFYFAIPPFDVQQRIIAEVERRFSVLDQVEATVNASLRRCGQLRQAVLKRAFGG